MNPPNLLLVQEIQSIGDWLIKSCETEPLPDNNLPEPGTTEYDKFWTLYLPHWRYPRAMGHMCRGMAYTQLGLKWNQLPLDTKDGRRGPLAGNYKDLKAAAEEYTKAAAWLPDDDPETCQALW